jgi:hypothetical protein
MADKPATVIDGSDGVWCRVRSYEVSVFPDGHECVSARTWKLDLEYAGDGLWAVTQGPYFLGPDGTLESPADLHAYPLGEALALAREFAPKVTINDMTALEILARHEAGAPECHR